MKESQAENLRTVEEIKRDGLEAVVSKYSLKCNDYSYKVSLTYNTIESPKGEQVVQECRGLVLEKGTWRIMSYPFKKFFNLGEGHAQEIDWSTARVYTKEDGTMIHVYWDWVKGELSVGTTGTAEAEGQVGMVEGLTFAQLFWQSYPGKKDLLEAFCQAGNVAMFELCTELNQVVAHHAKPKVVLLSARKLELVPHGEVVHEALTLLGATLGVAVAESHPIADEVALVKALDGKPFHDEGFVVCDAQHRRLKVKNPAYVAVHHLRGRSGPHHIVDVVRNGDFAEFLAYFPDMRRRAEALGKALDSVTERMNASMTDVLSEMGSSDFVEISADKEQRKRYALLVQARSGQSFPRELQGYYFSRLGSDPVEADEYLRTVDAKMLHSVLMREAERIGVDASYSYTEVTEEDNQ